MNSSTRHGAVKALVVLAVLALAGSAGGEEVEFSFAHARTISSANGAARILLDPGDLSVLDGELITSAFLRIPLPGNVSEQDLDIVVHALGTAWADREAGWEAPWTRPGGDLDSRNTHTVRLGKGRAATRLAIDVTIMVQEMTDGVAGKNGFLLTVPTSRGEGFTAAGRALLGTMAGGKLVVSYRRISELGYSNGSLSLIDR